MISDKVRIRKPCDQPGCNQTLCDSSGLARHKWGIHGIVSKRKKRNETSGGSRKGKHSVAAQVVPERDTEDEDRGEDPDDILGQFATLSVAGPQASGSSTASIPSPSRSGNSSAGHVPSLPPSSNNNAMQSNAGRPGVTTGVHVDCSSYDNSQIEHQQANSAHQAASPAPTEHPSAPLRAPPETWASAPWGTEVELIQRQALLRAPFYSRRLFSDRVLLRVLPPAIPVLPSVPPIPPTRLQPNPRMLFD